MGGSGRRRSSDFSLPEAPTIGTVWRIGVVQTRAGFALSRIGDTLNVSIYGADLCQGLPARDLFFDLTMHTSESLRMAIDQDADLTASAQQGVPTEPAVDLSFPDRSCPNGVPSLQTVPVTGTLQ